MHGAGNRTGLTDEFRGHVDRVPIDNCPVARWGHVMRRWHPSLKVRRLGHLVTLLCIYAFTISLAGLTRSASLILFVVPPLVLAALWWASRRNVPLTRTEAGQIIVRISYIKVAMVAEVAVAAVLGAAVWLRAVVVGPVAGTFQAPALFFGSPLTILLGAVVALWCVARSFVPIALVIDENGLVDQTRIVGLGRLSWTEIGEAHLIGDRYIDVTVKRPDRFIRRIPRWRRVLLRMLASTGSIAIPVWFVREDPVAVVEAINRRGAPPREGRRRQRRRNRRKRKLKR